MEKRSDKGYWFRKTKVTPALWLALAFSMLIASCPVKRFLLKDSIKTSTTKSHQTNINKNDEWADAGWSQNFSFAKKPLFTTELYQPVKLQAPVFFLNNHKPGFKINYFLSGTNIQYPLSTFDNSSLPLFLQHLRLLI
ncbi:MAG: hypothetical protein ACTHK0_10735 [Ginsengibacter sp.]